ncbi:MAG: ParB N-terminal domain-containing protein, partial [Pseudomonadota bacterium]|nr:ParB N-terminal domain-containing protein [Pseudomonadota bacterium]
MNLFQDTQAIDGVHADAVIDVAQHPQSGTPKVVQYRDYGAPSHGRKSRRSAEPKTVSINSFRCRVWERHARLEEYITEETCRTEIASVKAHGQLIPVLVRPLLGDVNYDYELIYGARRLFVARHLNVPLLAEVRRLSDRDAAIHVDIENRQRKDISPYERGRCYHQWLSSGLFQ